MKHAIVGAFVMTLTMSLLGAIIVWGAAVNIRAVTSDNARRRKQGLPPAPLWYESLWKRSPDFVLSGIYICLSVAFALYLLDFAASSILKLKGGLESPYELYEQCTPMAVWIGCGIWLTALLAALLVFVRSAMSLPKPDVSSSNPTTREHFQRVSKLVRRAWMAGGSILGVFVAWRYPDLTRIQRDVVVSVLLILIFMAFALIPGRVFKCPRCGTDLKRLQAKQVGETRRDTPKFWEAWDACPNCRVSFDEPYYSRDGSPNGRSWSTGPQEVTRD